MQTVQPLLGRQFFIRNKDETVKSFFPNNREGGDENIKVKSNLCQSEHEMTKFMSFMKRIKK